MDEGDKKLLAELHPDLIKSININALVPYLHKHGLVTEEELEFLTNEYKTSDEKINKLISWLQKKGPEALKDFVKCLDESGTGTGHMTIARKITTLSCSARKFNYKLDHPIDNLDQGILFSSDRIKKKICENLDIAVILPSLAQHRLVTSEEEDYLSDPANSMRKKMIRLMLILPVKGDDFLSRFLICLAETQEDAPCHEEIISIIGKSASIMALKRLVAGCVCKCICYPCGFCCFLILILLLIAAVGRLTSYYGIDEPELIPFSDLPKRYFKSLPRMQNMFVGRVDEINQVMTSFEFESDIKIVGIFGGPGFGKSTFAIQVCHRLVKSFNFTVEYYDLSEVSYVPHLIHRILGSGINVTDHLSVLEELKHWADSIDTSTVLLLDGCDVLLKGSQQEDLQKVIKLLVNHSNHIKVLFTSRYVVSFLNQFKSVTMNELKIKDATKLLKKHASGTSEDALEKIASLVGNVPLALQVVGALLETRSISPEIMIDELSENPIEALKLDALPKESQINTSLQLSYKRLDEFTQRCGRCLANFPGSFSKDAVFSVVNYMINETYWYAEPLIELNMFLHWLPKPSTCLKTLVRHSLLKYHSTSDRYSFHKLIREFFLHVEFKEGDTLEEKKVFKIGFFLYFTDYWNSFHGSVKTAASTPSLLAALDIERHNFELMEEILPEFGHDLQYVHKYIRFGMLLATSYEDSRYAFSYFHQPGNDIHESQKRLETYNTIILIIDCHSKIAIKEQGIQDYMDMYIELMVRKYLYEEYLYSSERAFENLNSRRHRITQLYEEYGDPTLEAVTRYFKHILDYSLRVADVDGYMEALQKTVALKMKANVENFDNELEKGLNEFALGKYKKALKCFKHHLKKNMPFDEFLYTKILTFYCFKFRGNEDAALKLIKELDQFSLYLKLPDSLADVNREYLEVAYSFYKTVRPGSLGYKLLKGILAISSVWPIRVIHQSCKTEDCSEEIEFF